MGIFSKGGFDAGIDDTAEFVAFFGKIGKPGLGQHFASADNFEPDSSFVKFFQTNLEFVDKVIRTFGPTSFSVMSRGRCPAP
jgi:hypothetical protein